MATSGTQKANTIGSGERTYVSFLNGKIPGTADFSSCIEEGRWDSAVGTRSWSIYFQIAPPTAHKNGGLTAPPTIKVAP